MGQIILKVMSLDWTEGNVGHVHLRLDGGTCRVDWGDGHTTGLKVQGREWVDLQGKACAIADFSNSKGLRKLHVGYGDKSFIKLDLTGCDNLETLYCNCNYHLRRIAISNRSILKEVVHEDTPVDDRCFEILGKIVRKNGGYIAAVSDS